MNRSEEPQDGRIGAGRRAAKRESIGQDTWQPCEAGELADLARHNERMERRAWLRVAGARSLASLGVIVVGGWSASYLFEQDRRPIVYHCEQVVPRLPDYLAGKLTVVEVKRVDAHLDGCPECQERLAILKEQLGVA